VAFESVNSKAALLAEMGIEVEERTRMAVVPNIDALVVYPRNHQHVRLRLFCFPYAGGGASAFLPWAANLPPAVGVYPVQLPGRENRLREPPFVQLSSLIQMLAHALLPYLDIPCAFFGHSMGALISFELARHLRKQYDLDPAHLFVSGHPAPHMARPASHIHQLPEAAFIEELRKLQGAPESILGNSELMRLFLPTLRADFAVCETYTYTSDDPLASPISAFGGRQDAKVSHDALAGWRDQACSTFTLRMLPGNHFFLYSARALLLQAISQDLTRLL
jgi:medium-chain acyl-[acyl-carrier-protein] hydrolase